MNGTNLIYRAACQFLDRDPSWDPTPSMPAPTVPQIQINADGKEDEDVFRETIRRIYDICADDSALRGKPQEFDRLRAEYPIRREFPNTQVRLQPGRESVGACLRALGFRVL